MSDDPYVNVVDADDSVPNVLMKVISTEIEKHHEQPLDCRAVKRRHSLLSEDDESEFGDDDDTASLSGMSRKEKSLGLLCQKFLTCMGEESSAGRDIHLEHIARKIDVEKRRIYDIVNVMEALEAMVKSTKAYYRWQGLTHLPQLMARLQQEAEYEGLPARIEQVERAMCSFTELINPARDDAQTKKSTLSTETVGTILPDRNDSGFWGSRESLVVDGPKVRGRDRTQRNSLSMLCRRFLMVLLSNPNNKKVSLDVASTVLIKDPNSKDFAPPSRSRCRRLYDIANVLVAMGLIKKVHYLFGTKKIPLFVYSGPEPDATGMLPVADPSQLLALTRQTSFEEDQIIKAKRRKTSKTLQRQPSLLEICEVAAQERARLSTSADLDSSSLADTSSETSSTLSEESVPYSSSQSSTVTKPPSPNENIPVLHPQQPIRDAAAARSGVVKYNIVCPKPQLGETTAQRQYKIQIGSNLHTSTFSKARVLHPVISKPATVLPPQRRYSAPPRYISAPVTPLVGAYDSPLAMSSPVSVGLPLKPVQASPLVSTSLYVPQMLKCQSIYNSGSGIRVGSAFTNVKTAPALDLSNLIKRTSPASDKKTPMLPPVFEDLLSGEPKIAEPKVVTERIDSC